MISEVKKNVCNASAKTDSSDDAEAQEMPIPRLP